MQKDAKNKKSFSNTKIILIGIFLLSLSMRLPALFTRHIENDEVILQVLADKLSQNLMDYSLQGTPVLNQLPKVVYDKPLFHHPPLFVYGLMLFKLVLGAKFEILLPILCSVLTLLVIFAIGKELYSEVVGLVAALIFSLCPIVLHASTKIWIDAPLTLFCTLSVYLSILAVKRERALFYILAGVSFGLVLLSKISGLAILGPIAYLFIKGIHRKRLGNILYFLIFSALIAGPWFLVFYRTFGTIFPWWIKPSDEPLHMFPFIRMAMARPVYFYFSNISKVAPIYIFAWILMSRRIIKPSKWLETVWAFSFIGAFTWVGMVGLEGYVTRYVLPAIPALSLLSASFIVGKNKIIWIIGGIFLAYGLTNAVLNSYLFQVADVFPLSYFMQAIR